MCGHWRFPPTACRCLAIGRRHASHARLRHSGQAALVHAQTDQTGRYARYIHHDDGYPWGAATRPCHCCRACAVWGVCRWVAGSAPIRRATHSIPQRSIHATRLLNGAHHAPLTTYNVPRTARDLRLLHNCFTFVSVSAVTQDGSASHCRSTARLYRHMYPPPPPHTHTHPASRMRRAETRRVE